MINGLICSKKEGEYWDFKQEWHAENYKLVLDIICFANTVHNKDCFLIIGVSDDGKIIGLNGESTSRKKQADLLDLINNIEFEGTYIPNIRLDTIIIEKKEVDVITIHNSKNTPFYIRKQYGKIIPGNIYMRKGDRNTPISQNSSIHDIELLWKKRLGLLLPPYEQLKMRLKNKNDWEKHEDSFYYIYNPDFKIRIVPDDTIRTRKEYYLYLQDDNRAEYSYLEFVYRETILDKIGMVSLDGARLFTVVPKWGFVYFDKMKRESIPYRYIVSNSIEEIVQTFFYDEMNFEQNHSKLRFDEVVLYFKNSDERKRFEDYVNESKLIFEKYHDEQMKKNIFIDEDDEKLINYNKDRIIKVKVLKKMYELWCVSNKSMML